MTASIQPESKTQKITRAIFKITNPCAQPHYFRIKSDIKDPRFKQQTDAILVGASSTEQIEVVFDAMGSKTDLKAGVECLDCKKEDGCIQDPYLVPIEITAVNTVLRTAKPSVSTKFSSGMSTQAGAHDVGIIPQSSGACPVGSEYILIRMDDEDNHNASSVSGWVGDISHYSTGTTFGFCRVDGNQFYSLPYRDYAILQLGTNSCPNGSMPIQRTFDNEHNNNKNWNSENISPSDQIGTKTLMRFCFFKAGSNPTMTSFPNLYVPYGVFAAPPSLVGLPIGTVHTDDEDVGNADNTCKVINSTTCVADPYLYYFAMIINGGNNTDLHVTKVSNSTSCTNPCPYIGSYDGANCWVGQPPTGTNAFIWSTNFYYTPISGHQCPRQGSWYDGANCFMMAIPSQTNPFIWSNMWYVQPACRP